VRISPWNNIFRHVYLPYFIFISLPPWFWTRNRPDKLCATMRNYTSLLVQMSAKRCYSYKFLLRLSKNWWKFPRKWKPFHKLYGQKNSFKNMYMLSKKPEERLYDWEKNWKSDVGRKF